MATGFERLRDELLIDHDAEQLWIDEICRRYGEIKSGRAILRPVTDVMRDARERLRSLK